MLLAPARTGVLVNIEGDNGVVVVLDHQAGLVRGGVRCLADALADVPVCSGT